MVHIFKQNGQNIALDVESGAVHSLSPLAYAILEQLIPENPAANAKLPPNCPSSVRYELAKFDSRDIDAAYAELLILYENGQLFAEPALTHEDFRAVKGEGKIKALCLHISHDCNLRCAYCFAGDGTYNHARSVMDAETGRRAIDFLIGASGNIRNLEVDFFGGEPMLNFDVVREITRYGRERETAAGKNIRFTLTTNGTLLDDSAIDYINENFSNVVLSLDGRREVNDSARAYAGGGGTYDELIPLYKKLVERRGGRDYYIRGTFTRNSLDFADDVLHLADLGFEQLSIEPVVLPDEHPLSIREEDLGAVCAEYERLAKLIVERNRQGKRFNFFHFMVDLDAGPCVYKRLAGCGSAVEYAAITPDGGIFPCHQFVPHEEFQLGSVTDDNTDNCGTDNKSTQLDEKIRGRFRDRDIFTTPDCADCFAKYFCGGGCPANNHKYNGKIEQPYSPACVMERKRLECALMIKAAEI